MPSVNLALAAVLAVVITAVVSAAAGYYQGLERGELNVTAQHDSETVNNLNGLIASHQDLVDEANQASVAIRETLRKRSQQDQVITQGLKDALAKQQQLVTDQQTLAANFRYSADVMQQLTVGHQRATQAAAGGLNGAVPTTESTPGGHLPGHGDDR